MIAGHGGNIKKLATTLGCDPDEILDMSSNLNPLGPPERIERFICENVAQIRSLPEPDAASMAAGFARFLGIDARRVLAGNGTTWFIYTLPLALKVRKALVSGPTYSDYRDACHMFGAVCRHFLADENLGFQPDMDRLSRMAADADILFVCNPGNPTGVVIERDQILSLLKKNPDTVIVVDESYLPFADQAETVSLATETGFDNLVILSSMSKIYRIPGLRTGFLSAGPGVIEKIMAYYQPWSVNALAQAVVTHIFDHPEEIHPFMTATRAYVGKERARFLEKLDHIHGIEALDSATCFVLARLTGNTTAPEFCEKIGRHRILIRDCSNFTGLSPHHVRFSLKTMDINDRLADLIQQEILHD